jgi:hypothetical protein
VEYDVDVAVADTTLADSVAIIIYSMMYTKDQMKTLVYVLLYARKKGGRKLCHKTNSNRGECVR